MGTASRRAYGVVVPVRAFRSGNTRLAPDLDEATRTDLARRLAGRVVAAANLAPVVVVTSAPEVEAWARELGVATVPDPGSLDDAARVGADALAALGCERVVVAHADLPFVTSFDAVGGDDLGAAAAIVPCHHDDGTPVLSIPAEARTRFAFAYGAGSFRRHVAAARAAGLGVHVVREPTLRFDVDTIDDVDALTRADPTLLGIRAPEATT